MAQPGLWQKGPDPSRAAMHRISLLPLTIAIRAVRWAIRSRFDLVLENIALKQRVETLKQKRPRLQLADVDRTFWAAMRRLWGACAEADLGSTTGPQR